MKALMTSRIVVHLSLAHMQSQSITNRIGGHCTIRKSRSNEQKFRLCFWAFIKNIVCYGVSDCGFQRQCQFHSGFMLTKSDFMAVPINVH